MDKAKLYKLTNTLFSFLIGFVALLYLYYSFDNKAQVVDFYLIVRILVENATTLFLISILTVLNWTVELLKWNILLKRVQLLTVRQLIESLTLGILLGIITPNRIGELGGRQLYIRPKKRLLAFYYQSFGAASQLLVTAIMGLVALGYYMFWKEGNYLYLGLALFLVLTLLTLYTFSNLWVKILTFTKRKVKKLENQELASIQLKDRINTLLLAGVRYFIFCTQFVIIFKLFSMTGEDKFSLIGLSITFFASAFIPSNWISEIAVRSSIIYYVFDKLELDSSAAVFSSIVLWGFNLLIPSLLGLLSIRKVNWSKFVPKGSK